MPNGNCFVFMISKGSPNSSSTLITLRPALLTSTEFHEYVLTLITELAAGLLLLSHDVNSF